MNGIHIEIDRHRQTYIYTNITVIQKGRHIHIYLKIQKTTNRQTNR